MPPTSDPTANPSGTPSQDPSTDPTLFPSEYPSVPILSVKGPSEPSHSTTIAEETNGQGNDVDDDGDGDGTSTNSPTSNANSNANEGAGANDNDDGDTLITELTGNPFNLVFIIGAALVCLFAVSLFYFHRRMKWGSKKDRMMVNMAEIKLEK